MILQTWTQGRRRGLQFLTLQFFLPAYPRTISNHSGGLPGGPVVKTALPIYGAQVQSLVGGVKSHMCLGTAKKKILTAPNFGFPLGQEQSPDNACLTGWL